jgi:hypothetical protein
MAKSHKHSGQEMKRRRETQSGDGADKQTNPDTQNSAFAKVGPQSVDGIEASDLPDKGRGSPEQEQHYDIARKPMNHQGGVIGNGTDPGLRADPDLAEADDHGTSMAS